MEKMRWGILGAGKISSKFATALNALDEVELTAVASRDPARAKEFAERFHISKAYTGYENLVQDPEIDVVYIGTPHTEHKDNAALCILNKKAVLCEKPFTLNQKETHYLMKLAKENDVFLMEAMWTKFLPVTNLVKKWIADKIIGNVLYFNISFGYRSEFDENSRLFNPSLAGGALLDVGIYPIAYVIHMMDKLPDQVVSSACLGKSRVDEMNVITFRYNDGVMADLSSAISAKTGKNAVIVCEKGKIVVPDFWRAQKAELYDEDDRLIETVTLPFHANGYEYEIKEVNRCIREGRKESLILPLQNTLDIMKIMDGIRADWGLVYPKEKE